MKTFKVGDKCRIDSSLNSLWWYYHGEVGFIESIDDQKDRATLNTGADSISVPLKFLKHCKTNMKTLKVGDKVVVNATNSPIWKFQHGWVGTIELIYEVPQSVVVNFGSSKMNVPAELLDDPEELKTEPKESFEDYVVKEAITKPELGIRPIWVWENERINEIEMAIKRRFDNDQHIPADWEIELFELKLKAAKHRKESELRRSDTLKKGGTNIG